MRTQQQITEHRSLVFKQFPAGRNGKNGAPKAAAEVKEALASEVDPTYVNEAIKHFVQKQQLGSIGKGPSTRYFRPAKIEAAPAPASAPSKAPKKATKAKAKGKAAA